jgi:hypothetical protein
MCNFPSTFFSLFYASEASLELVEWGALQNVRFEILTAVLIVWVVTPCQFLGTYRRFERMPLQPGGWGGGCVAGRRPTSTPNYVYFIMRVTAVEKYEISLLEN